MRKSASFERTSELSDGADIEPLLALVPLVVPLVLPVVPDVPEDPVVPLVDPDEPLPELLDEPREDDAGMLRLSSSCEICV